MAAFSRLTPKTSPVSKLPHALGLSWVFVWCFLGLRFFFFWSFIFISPARPNTQAYSSPWASPPGSLPRPPQTPDQGVSPAICPAAQPCSHRAALQLFPHWPPLQLGLPEGRSECESQSLPYSWVYPTSQYMGSRWGMISVYFVPINRCS